MMKLLMFFQVLVKALSEFKRRHLDVLQHPFDQIAVDAEQPPGFAGVMAMIGMNVPRTAQKLGSTDGTAAVLSGPKPLKHFWRDAAKVFALVFRSMFSKLGAFRVSLVLLFLRPLFYIRALIALAKVGIPLLSPLRSLSSRFDSRLYFRPRTVFRRSDTPFFKLFWIGGFEHTNSSMTVGEY